MTTKVAKKSVRGPIVPFAEFSARIKAVARGEETAPEWAGKQVYATESARQYWTQQRILDPAQVAGIAKLLSDNQEKMGTDHVFPRKTWSVPISRDT
jgi:DNA-binding response OmpR family regulator